MKISLILDNDKHTVTWDKEINEFPNVVQYDNKYWEWVCFEKDPSGFADQVLFFGQTREEALPVNLFGQLFPVPNLREMFNLTENDEPCWCGAKFSSFPNHHMIKCPKWIKL